MEDVVENPWSEKGSPREEQYGGREQGPMGKLESRTPGCQSTARSWTARPAKGPFFGGQVATAGDFSRTTWDELATGQAHDITIELVGGDATAVDVGVIIYEAD